MGFYADPRMYLRRPRGQVVCRTQDIVPGGTRRIESPCCRDAEVFGEGFSCGAVVRTGSIAPMHKLSGHSLALLSRWKKAYRWTSLRCGLLWVSWAVRELSAMIWNMVVVLTGESSTLSSPTDT